MRVRLRLDTMSDIRNFVKVVQPIEETITLKDGAGSSINAKSLIGCLHAIEFDKIYCCCKTDIAGLISEWII